MKRNPEKTMNRKLLVFERAKEMEDNKDRRNRGPYVVVQEQQQQAAAGQAGNVEEEGFGGGGRQREQRKTRD
jgi:hypothetical protein